MRKSDFYYDLPQALIAQRPASPRDSSRLLCLHRGSDAMEHRVFSELPGLLRAGDLLVMNDTRVLPARLVGRKQDTGGVAELLLLRQRGTNRWECLAKPGKRLRAGAVLVFGEGDLHAAIREDLPDGGKLVEFMVEPAAFLPLLEKLGQMPLPPYIKSRLQNSADYQTVFARAPGSAAAPTAGLHFTPGLLAALGEAGVKTAFVTLHVGLGTFRPVQEDEVENHRMHSEWYEISEETARRINEAKRRGGRVIAVGTTSCRTLESVVKKHGEIRPDAGETDIFIYPGVALGAIDGLLTNFHLPESTLIMLVAAFYGKDKTMAAYAEAVKRQYRFFSFGDAMLIL